MSFTPPVAGWAAVAVILGLAFSAAAQETTLRLNPDRTVVKFTLGDVLHTVHGTFQLKGGALHFDASTHSMGGEIVVDAQSGRSGNQTRDRKMHKEILESARYGEISFHPDRFEGNVATQGRSTVQVHGIFNIHGVDHEMTVPAQVEMSPEAWSAAIHFPVPYVKWGMKNPSTLFLRVTDTVDIDVSTTGNILKQNN